MKAFIGGRDNLMLTLTESRLCMTREEYFRQIKIVRSTRSLRTSAEAYAQMDRMMKSSLHSSVIFDAPSDDMQKVKCIEDVDDFSESSRDTEQGS
jgi:hypothetical protein